MAIWEVLYRLTRYIGWNRMDFTNFLIDDWKIGRFLPVHEPLSRNLTDNSRKRNELHMESGGLFSDSF
jgi:hypothetical protein